MLFDGFLLCTDLDGTLVGADGAISEQNARAIAYFQANGGKFTVSTGRFHGHVAKFRDRVVPNAPVICLGGTLVYDTEKGVPVGAFPLPETAFDDAMELFEAFPEVLWVTAWTATGSRVIERAEVENGARPQRENAPYHKFVFFLPGGVTDAFRARAASLRPEQYMFEQSWFEGIELLPHGCGKGHAVSFLREHLGGIRRVVCVGDYGNDISMLKAADVGYAVANATDAVKAAADRLAPAHTESPFVRIIEEMEKDAKTKKQA